MTIFCPFAEGKLRPETKKALGSLANVHFVQMDENSSYHRYWQARWKEGKRFINVEHDCAPTVDQLADLWACPHDWCSIGYNNDLIPFFGCVKFSSDFIKVHQFVWEVPLMDWTKLDMWLAGHTNVYFKPHLHGSMWHAKRYPGASGCSPISAANV